MDLIILNDGIYHLIPVTKKLLEGMVITQDVDCFELCDLLRLKLTGRKSGPEMNKIIYVLGKEEIIRRLV